MGPFLRGSATEVLPGSFMPLGAAVFRQSLVLGTRRDDSEAADCCEQLDTCGRIVTTKYSELKNKRIQFRSDGLTMLCVSIELGRLCG